MKSLRIVLLAALPLLGLPLATTGSASAGPTLTHGVTFADAAGPLSPWPEYAAGVDRYALPTTATTAGAVTVTPTTDDVAGTIEVDGQPVASGTPVELTGLEPGDEISVVFHEGAVTTAQSWFYLPVGYPQLTASGNASATPVFVTMSSFGRATQTNFESAVDRNGVPFHVREGQAGDFKASSADPTHFTSIRKNGPDGTGSYEVVDLDPQFQVVKTYQLDGIPDSTDFHDAQLLPGGGAVLMGYDAGSGNIDAVIQIVDSAGHATFTWNSKDYVTPSEAFVDGGVNDYAHINSLQLLGNGDIVASFRNLSQVMRIATTAHDGFAKGDVVWRFGGKLTDFTIVGDPLAGFCAQHAAHFLPNGHLMIFDNGSRLDTTGPIRAQTADMCPDPANPTGPRIARPQSRVVEYSLDETGHVATYVGERAVPGRYAAFAGNGQRLANGNTFVGWSLSEPNGSPVASEIDPDNNELWTLSSPGWFSYRAFTFPAPDKIAPVVTGALDGHVFHVGDTATAAYSCTDTGGSNLVSCVGDTAWGAPLDLSPGQHTLHVTATDGAGNQTVQPFTYTVEATWQPDGWVRTPGADWRGKDVYGGIAGQQLSVKVARAGGTVTAAVTLQNDGDAPDRLAVAGSAGTSRIGVRYYLAGADVTRAVTRGTFRTAGLGIGERVQLKVVLTRTKSAQAGDRLRARLDLHSVGDPAKTDAVAVTLRAV